MAVAEVQAPIPQAQESREWQAREGNLASGFTQMPNWVRRDPTLSIAAKAVYEHLLSYMYEKEWCWPSQEKIAGELGISRRTVIRACNELYHRGYIERWRRGLGQTNVYFINPQVFVASFKDPNRGRGVVINIEDYQQQPHFSTLPLPPLLLGTRAEDLSNQEQPVVLADELPTLPDYEEQSEQLPTDLSEEDSLSAAFHNNPGDELPVDLLDQEQPMALAEELQELVHRPTPDFIVGIMADYSLDLGDAYPRSSVTRATKIFYTLIDLCPDFPHDPVLAEETYRQLLQDVKAQSLELGVIQHRNGKRINRMPAFFACLENALGMNEEDLAYLRSDAPLYHSKGAP